jgi:hypothetical protein
VHVREEVAGAAVHAAEEVGLGLETPEAVMQDFLEALTLVAARGLTLTCTGGQQREEGDLAPGRRAGVGLGLEGGGEGFDEVVDLGLFR